MTADELDTLEHELGLTLPPPYRATMLAYPFAADSVVAELWLVADAAVLLAENRRCRTNTTVPDAPWPAHLLVIGSDGGEEIYALDTASAPYPVRTLSVETGRFEPLSPSFEVFVARQRSELAEVEASEKAMAKAYRNRKWWQFWIRPYPPNRST